MPQDGLKAIQNGSMPGTPKNDDELALEKVDDVRRQMDKLVSQVVKVLDAIGEGSESSRLQSQVWAA